MIAKMKSNLSAKETLLYNDKEESEIIFTNNLTGENRRDVEKQMEARHRLFTGRAKNLTAHIMISPSIEDGKKLTRLDWKEIGNSFLQKAKLSSYQSIAYLHKDKEHFHLHIVANRIDKRGKIYRNGNELVMSQKIGDEIAVERGLKRAAEIRRERRLAREKGIIIKNDVGSVALMREVVANAAINAWKSGKFQQEVYFNGIKSKGFEVRLFFKKNHENKTTNELRGYAIGRKGEHLINASQIGSEFTLRRLMREAPISSRQPLINNEQIKDSIRKDLQACFDKLVRNEARFDPHQFLNEVTLSGNPVKEYHHKDTGKLRGYAIEKDSVIFNASEIGTEFTLTNLQKRFNELKLSVDPEKKVPEQKMRHPKTSHEEFHPDPGDQISKELKRTIDLTIISSDLRDLTSGHKYESYNDFIKAVEEKGYHVHLRYDKGNLSGYTVHNGMEHYHDKEIGNGQFGLHRLEVNGLFKEPGIKTNQFQKSSVADIYRAEVTQQPINKHNQAIEDTSGANRTHILFLENEIKRKKDLDKDQVRKLIAKELLLHAKAIIQEYQSFDVLKYLDRLKENAFHIVEHKFPDSGLLRGYSVQKYGYTFQASEVGRNFSLYSLKELAAELLRPEKMKVVGVKNRT